MSLNVLVAETEKLLSDLLGEQFRKTFPEANIRCICTLEELSASEPKSLDLTVVDLILNDGDVLGWLNTRMKGFPRGKVMVLTSHEKDYLLHNVFRSAVAGIVHKADGLEALEMAVRTVLAGGSYFSPRIQEIRTRLHADQRLYAHVLSLREQSILKLIGMGTPSAMIAKRLGIREATVVDHRKNIMQKLGVHTQSELVTYALEKGFAHLRKR
jgi:DNA-binding NarL/FixJ family response regulator